MSIYMPLNSTYRGERKRRKNTCSIGIVSETCSHLVGLVPLLKDYKGQTANSRLSKSWIMIKAHSGLQSHSFHANRNHKLRWWSRLIASRFGRKTAAVFAGTMGAVLGLAKSFATSFWCYVLLEGLEAAIGDALSPMFMLSEFLFSSLFMPYCWSSLRYGIFVSNCANRLRLESNTSRSSVYIRLDVEYAINFFIGLRSKAKFR